MKTNRLLSSILFCLFLFNFNGKAQEFKWLRSPSTYTYPGPKAITDATGSVYLTGTFSNTISLGTATLSTNHAQSTYLAKYGRKGDVRWAINLAPTEPIEFIDVDASPTGEVYVLGSFWDTLHIAGQTLVNPNLGTDFSYLPGYFIAKVQRKGSGFLWGKLLNGYPSDIAVDGGGNVVITGSFIKQMQLGNIVISDSSEWDSFTFLAKYASTGQLLWLKKSLISTNFVQPQVSVTQEGVPTLSWVVNVVIPLRASLLKQALPDGGTIEEYPEAGYFARYSVDGRCLWVKKSIKLVNGTLPQITQTSQSTDEYGRIYITGVFAGEIIIGTDTLRSAFTPGEINEDGDEFLGSYREEIYIAMFNRRGEALWAKQSMSNSIDPIWNAGLSIDTKGGVWLAGSFTDLLSFDGNQISTSGGSQNAFLSHYSSNGEMEWITTAGGNQGAFAQSLAADGNGGCYLSGSCAPGANFGALTHITSSAAFLSRVVNNYTSDLRISQPVISSSEAADSPLRMSAFPNPFTDQTVLSMETKDAGTVLITISDLSGRVVAIHSVLLSNNSTRVPLDLGSLPAGVYLVTVTSGDQQAFSRLIKQ